DHEHDQGREPYQERRREQGTAKGGICERDRQEEGNPSEERRRREDLRRDRELAEQGQRQEQDESTRPDPTSDVTRHEVRRQRDAEHQQEVRVPTNVMSDVA